MKVAQKLITRLARVVGSAIDGLALGALRDPLIGHTSIHEVLRGCSFLSNG